MLAQADTVHEMAEGEPRVVQDRARVSVRRGVIRDALVEEREIARGAEILAQRPKKEEVQVARLPVNGRAGLLAESDVRVGERAGLRVLRGHREAQRLPRQVRPQVDQGQRGEREVAVRPDQPLEIAVGGALVDDVRAVELLVDRVRGEVVGVPGHLAREPRRVGDDDLDGGLRVSG